MKQNLVDEANFEVRAGNGGDGLVHFRREKYVPKGGPDGGDGGNGGSVFLETDVNINTLRFFAGKDRFEATSGKPGGKQKMFGKDGEDVVLKVPVGTVVYKERDQGSRGQHELVASHPIKDDLVLIVDMNEPEMRVCVARGGSGGRGNVHFKSATMQTPKIAEDGEKGEVKRLYLELKVLAQVGLVGLPNAGKSTLLSVLTKARPKIADYPFTTLAPNLGVMKAGKKELVVADIPGLIEGAHEGKGLGDKFLRHVERCKVLVYVLYPTEEMLSKLVGDKPAQSQKSIFKLLERQFEEVKKELKSFNEKLVELPQVVVLNKIDVMDDKVVEKLVAEFKKLKIELVPISAATMENLDTFRQKIVQLYGTI